MIVDLGSRAAALLEDEATATYASTRLVRVDLLPTAGSTIRQRRRLIEVLWRSGGLQPHALLGGEYIPGGSALQVEIAIGSRRSRGRPCRSQLAQRRLKVGLPDEYAESVVGGLARTLHLPSGLVRVDRAGYDPVESSLLAFELAAELLGRSLSSSMAAWPDPAVLRAWLEALP